MMKVTFLGAAGTVTGSKFLLTTNKARVLVDCGLYQGLKKLRERNWQKLPFEPEGLDAVILTHAHIDHSGHLPILVRDGFRGPIYGTPPTRSLCDIMLPDSGHLHEEDARYANKKGFSKHRPALPLYTEEDAREVSRFHESVGFGKKVRIKDLEFEFSPAGHILGAASAHVRHDGNTLLFSGDLGPPDDPLMPTPAKPGRPDWVIMESTYGDRERDDVDLVDALKPIVERTLGRGGVLLIPSFAVGRAQLLIYCLHKIFEVHGVPRAPVYLDSPMATDVTELYERCVGYHRLDAERVGEVVNSVKFLHTPQESMQLNHRTDPMVIVSAAGMLTGGRVVHHLKAHAGRRQNTIFLPGYQAPGTRGAALAGGKRSVKVHGQYVDVKAEVVQMDVFSAHADQSDLLKWIGSCAARPKEVWLVHGEPPAADELRRLITERVGCDVHVPDYGNTARYQP